MSRPDVLNEVAQLLGSLRWFGHWLAHAVVGLAFGLLIGRFLALRMRARGLHWSWAAGALALLIALHAYLGGLAALLLGAGAASIWHGLRLQREDRDSGADLAAAAARLRSPRDSVQAAWSRTTLAWRSRNGGVDWLRGGELKIGCDGRGRLVSVPFGGAVGGTHTLLVGATGSGKTVTQTWMALHAIEHGMGAIVLDPKGDSALRATLASAACRAGRRFIEWTPAGPCAYNPFARGSETELADKALAGERFTEPHYLRQAQRYLGHTVRALRAAGIETSLATIVEHLDPAALELLAREQSPELADVTHAYLDSLSKRQLDDLSGVRDRLSILAESDVGRWLDPGVEEEEASFDLLGAVQQRAVVYFGLDADKRPLLMQMLGAAIVQDLQTVVARLQAQPAPTAVVIDEFSALASEHVVRLFGRARSAGFSLILSTQELSDLRLPGREGLLEQVLGNLSLLIAHRQVVPDSARLIVGLAGSRGAWRTSRSSDGRVTRTRISEGVLSIEDVFGLAPGCAAAIVLADGRDARLVRVFTQQGRGR